MQTNPSDLKIHIAEPILMKEYVRLTEVEESILWWKDLLNIGDKNSKFFFNLVKGYHNRNKILLRVKDTIKSYFEKHCFFFWGGGSNSDLVLDSPILFGALPLKII
jgi:hypothetical protein